MPTNARNDSNARLIHRHLRRSGPTSKPEVCSAVGIEEQDFVDAMRYSNRRADPEDLANEIICVTNRAPYVYYLAKKQEQSQDYRSQRCKVIDGHLFSVEALLKKEILKWPEDTRHIAQTLKQVERLREDLADILG